MLRRARALAHRCRRVGAVGAVGRALGVALAFAFAGAATLAAASPTETPPASSTPAASSPSPAEASSSNPPAASSPSPPAASLSIPPGASLSRPPGASLSRPLAAFGRVEVAPTSTSIYVGTVAMTMPVFARSEGRYESTYVAKVFPYFFSNETGRLTVELSDAALRQLERGETVAFTGHAVNTAGAERRVEGKATPSDATSGKLKVRVFVSKRIELIFNTTYRFPDAN